MANYPPFPIPDEHGVYGRKFGRLITDRTEAIEMWAEQCDEIEKADARDRELMMDFCDAWGKELRRRKKRTDFWFSLAFVAATVVFIGAVGGLILKALKVVFHG